MDMTRQAVTQHLLLLEDANLVAIVWQGREKLHYLNPVPCMTSTCAGSKNSSAAASARCATSRKDWKPMTMEKPDDNGAVAIKLDARESIVVQQRFTGDKT